MVQEHQRVEVVGAIGDREKFIGCVGKVVRIQESQWGMPYVHVLLDSFARSRVFFQHELEPEPELRKGKQVIVPCMTCGAHVEADGTIPVAMDEYDNPCDFICLGCIDQIDTELRKSHDANEERAKDELVDKS